MRQSGAAVNKRSNFRGIATVRVSQQDLKLESIPGTDTAGDACSDRRTRVAYAEKNWRNAVWTPRDAASRRQTKGCSPVRSLANEFRGQL